jgi:hypothetical protein
MSSPLIYESTDITPEMTCDQYRWRVAGRTRSRGRVQSLALALLYPARILAHLTEPAPAPGTHPAALYVSEQSARYGAR